jgi:hypothetical protein
LDEIADALAYAVGTGCDASAEGLADRNDIRLQPPNRGAATGPGADRVRLVDDQQAAISRTKLAHGLVITRYRQHDSDVRQRGLEQAGRNISMGERRFEGGEVVDFDDARGQVERHGLADVAVASDSLSLIEHRHGPVDRSVVTAVVHDDLRPTGDFSRPADRTAVRIGGRERELPVGDAEAPRKLVTDPGGILGRQHQGDAFRRLFRDRVDRRFRRVSRHAAGVAQAEIDELVAVHVAESRTFGAVDIDRMITGQRVIQFIGTPNRSERLAASASRPLWACRARKVARSRSIRRESSVVAMLTSA